MERMKKILTSPINKKKSVVTLRYFGVPLEELARREGSTIPQLVQKICIFQYRIRVSTFVIRSVVRADLASIHTCDLLDVNHSLKKNAFQ